MILVLLHWISTDIAATGIIQAGKHHWDIHHQMVSWDKRRIFCYLFYIYTCILNHMFCFSVLLWTELEIWFSTKTQSRAEIQHVAISNRSIPALFDNDSVNDLIRGQRGISAVWGAGGKRRIINAHQAFICSVHKSLWHSPGARHGRHRITQVFTFSAI